MANRNQDYQSGRERDEGRGNANRWREEDDDGRYSGASERDYGSYADSEEGGSVRAGSYEQGRGRYGRDTGDQSGSTGRYAGYGDFGQGDYSGGRRGNARQDRYGQSGYGQGGYGQGGYGQEGRYRGGNYGGGTYGRGNYGQSNWRGDDEGRDRGSESNYGGGSRSFSGYGYEGSGSRGSNYGGGASGLGYGSSGYGSSNFGGQRDQGNEREYGNYQSSGQSSAQSAGQSSGWTSTGGWNEPYGEGQQYTQRGQYADQSMSRGMGEHRGKGPKGYQRSDDRLKEMICERLREDPHIDPSEVTLNVQGGKVTLEGTVDSRQTKNAIEDVAEQFGVQEVQNNLRVQRVSQAGEGARSQGKSSSEDDKSGKQNKH